jgi:hypothetical protein
LLLISAAMLVEPFMYSYSSTTLSWVWEAVLMYLVLFLAGLSPISAAVLTEVFLEEEGAILYFWYDVGSAHRIPLPSTWIVYTVLYLALALLLLLVTVLRVRQQERW